MINNLFKINKEKTGFSLIELSIVLAIVAVIISGSITISTTALKNAKVKNTKERLEIIQNAINVYVFINKRLPCPASSTLITTDVNYGVESGVAGTCSGTTSSDATANDIRYGAVPVKTLGLNYEFAGDGFGNKFSYIVSKELTQAFVAGSILGLEGRDISVIDNITVKETVSNSNITTIAAYVILSHGANGYGAYNINGSTHVTGSGVNDEDDNEDIAAFNDTFVVSSSDSNFDDVLVYSLKEDILKGAFGVNATICNSITYDPPTCGGVGVVTFPASRYYTTSTQNCTTATCASGTAKRTCSPNGQWETVIDACL